jgi:LPXTG-motif cell wall-anchored protein
VKASEIEGIADFYNCQVWLESTNATSRITTATEATNQTQDSTQAVSNEVQATGVQETTPAKDEVPKTGDNTPVVWLFVVALISGAGVLYFGKKKRGVRS